MQGEGAGLRILIVDDHDDTATAHRMLLEAEGHFVVTTASAEKALENMEGLKPEVAVLDLRLPGLSGADLLERMRERPELAECRYICVSGSDERDVPWQDLGFDAYLQKPVAIDQLRVAVRVEGEP